VRLVILNFFKIEVFATGWQRSTDPLQVDHPKIPVGIEVGITRDIARFPRDSTTFLTLVKRWKFFFKTQCIVRGSSKQSVAYTQTIIALYRLKRHCMRALPIVCTTLHSGGIRLQEFSE